MAFSRVPHHTHRHIVLATAPHSTMLALAAFGAILAFVVGSAVVGLFAFVWRRVSLRSSNEDPTTGVELAEMPASTFSSWSRSGSSQDPLREEYRKRVRGVFLFLLQQSQQRDRAFHGSTPTTGRLSKYHTGLQADLDCRLTPKSDWTPGAYLGKALYRRVHLLLQRDHIGHLIVTYDNTNWADETRQALVSSRGAGATERALLLQNHRSDTRRAIPTTPTTARVVAMRTNSHLHVVAHSRIGLAKSLGTESGCQAFLALERHAHTRESCVGKRTRPTPCTWLRQTMCSLPMLKPHAVEIQVGSRRGRFTVLVHDNRLLHQAGATDLPSAPLVANPTSSCGCATEDP